MSNTYSVRVINISSILSYEEMEVFTTMVTNSFSWGDTDLSLVSRDNLLSVLKGEADNDYRKSLFQKVALATGFENEIFVNLY